VRRCVGKGKGRRLENDEADGRGGWAWRMGVLPAIA